MLFRSLIKKLQEKGIESRPFFMPVHNMPPYIECVHGDMSMTEDISAKGINLPSSVSLTNEDIRKVCSIISSCNK